MSGSSNGQQPQAALDKPNINFDEKMVFVPVHHPLLPTQIVLPISFASLKFWMSVVLNEEAQRAFRDLAEQKSKLVLVPGGSLPKEPRHDDG